MSDMEYLFRNLPFSRKNCWKVSGKFPGCATITVLEWCPSKKDAEITLDSMSFTKEFTDLTIEKEPTYVLDINRVSFSSWSTKKFHSRRDLCQFMSNELAAGVLWKKEIKLNDSCDDENIVIGNYQYSLQEKLNPKEGGLVTWMKSHLRSEML